MDTNKSNNVAIIGAGISGLSLAYALAKKDSGFKLTIFESSSKLGGHSLTTDPVDFKETNGSTESTKLPPVDLGFQVMNRTTYPYLSEIFRELNVETEVSLHFFLSFFYDLFPQSLLRGYILYQKLSDACTNFKNFYIIAIRYELRCEYEWWGT